VETIACLPHLSYPAEHYLCLWLLPPAQKSLSVTGGNINPHGRQAFIVYSAQLPFNHLFLHYHTTHLTFFHIHVTSHFIHLCALPQKMIPNVFSY